MDGVIEAGFPGRYRGATERQFDRILFDIKPYPPRDDYPGFGFGFGRHTRHGTTYWPGTTKIAAVEKNQGDFKVTWKEGNMPRQPQTFEKWSTTAYTPEHERRNDDSWLMDYRKREEERKAKEERAHQELIENAKKEAVQEAEERHMAAVAKAEAQRRNAEIELERLQQLKLERDEAAGADGRLCVICLDADKSVMLQPCRHVVLCSSCAGRVHECPVCRVKVKSRVAVYGV